ncbi:HAE1 family hydrophobic/amphiphilic exporter-1 [Oikeobacillus pervagus]|uniref:HAE1 family hydrophobic/amphiphilic exporter-1 n=1 Tax=Oikeobacillus pervagus TaxID=1325931 RepID=A0AAJ1T030_9BACI|nr:efflux RND transporter permease subunit [Oikeobacillus pervagus]MDQ0214857.1 HAE1 family hydrophobic/amphiphilic exporter-1 [Oikeobacillus pervagus]
MKISQFSIKRPVFTIVTMALIMILGIVSLFKIPLKLIPDINPPVAVVVTSYQGASPTEIVEKVTKPLEANLATLPGIKNITSTTNEGSNFILMEFSWSTKIDEIQNDVLQRIDQTPLPEDANKPKFLKFDPSQFPIIQLSLRSTEEEDSIQKLAEKLEQELVTVKGVASVNVSGSSVEEVTVELNEENLKKYKLTQKDIVDLIQSHNISMPGDVVETGTKALTTRILSQLHNVEDIKNLVIATNPLNGEKIKISDVANVKSVTKESETITRANEKPAVLLSVLQQSDANTAEVSKDFQQRLEDLLKKDEYKNIQSDILFDQGDYIQLSISNIGNSLLLGGAFAMLVLFFFLRNIRSPLIIGVAIPYSVIVTFVLMYFAKFDLNIMTLGALALGIGMLVDNAIVVIENIYRHLSMGKDSKKAAYDGAKEVGAAITASTLTTIAVFLPVVFISGILGEIFKEFALTISFSLFASLIVALTVIPMMASRWLKPPKGDYEARRRRSKPMRRLDRSIRWALGHRALVLLFTFILLVGGGYGLTTVGTQFLPPTDEGFFSVRVDLENGSSLNETAKVVKAIEEELNKEEDIEVFVSLIGSTQEGAARGSGSPNIAEIYVKLKTLDKRDRSVFAIVDDMKKDIETSATKANQSAEVNINLQSATGTAPQTLVFSIQDSNKERLNRSVDKIYNSLKDLKDVTELSTDLTNKVDEIQIEIDREKAFEAGFVPAQIAMMVNDATRGVLTTQMINEQSNVQDVYVQYDKDVTKNLDKLKQILLKKPDGSYIALDKIAKVEVKEGPVTINRINQEDAVQFTLKYKSTTNLGDISKKVDEKMTDLNLPDETTISFGGEREMLENSVNDMIMAILLAIVLIYIVMAAQYESFKYPFVIMFSVPLMVIGVAIALTITRTPISITAVIGILILAGIVVNNGIVIVDYINQRKKSGLSSFEAIVESVKDRARPILMTALTTILGLVPIALGIGEGTELNQPMGITVIGGLISSTFLTLYIVPIIYSFFDKETRRMNKRKKTRR